MFSKLLQELRSSETDEYSSSILALINCLIAGNEDFDERVHIRNEFIGE